MRFTSLLLSFFLSCCPAVCAAQQETPPEGTGSHASATPDSDPVRFVGFQDVSDQPTMQGLGRDLIAQELALVEQDIATFGKDPSILKVLVGRYELADGRGLLNVTLCAGSLMGIIGCRNYIHGSGDGATWVRFRDGGGWLTWLDTAELHGGWPDLVFQNPRGINRPYGRWRWDGTTYDHVENWR